jgi:glucose/arabinose dehydrogenase
VRAASLVALLGLPFVACGPFEGDDVTSAGPARLVKVGDFASPTYLTAPRGDRRQFVTEREGRIRIVRGGRTLRTPFLDISDRVNPEGEGGLLSVAFAPDYEESGRFYVYYTDRAGYLQIDGFEVSEDDPDRADPASRRSIIRVPHHRGNHKGGQLQFGPDGYLYAGFGDGGGGGDPDGNAQRVSRMLGKLIRIDPQPDGGYRIPPDNPFRDRAGARPEIYSYGLRNPYRFSFDSEGGDLFIADVGQEEVEEVDVIEAGGDGELSESGQNFGWNVWEGTSRYRDGSAPGHVPPQLEEVRDDGFCSIIGGYVVRDRALGSEWLGRYVYGDLCNAAIRRASFDGDEVESEPSGLEVRELVSFGQDGQGRIYAVSLNGPVYRLARESR